ncbi:MAG: DUF134 domain-containing protein [Candidatus Zixiibacteriota bacterium]
MRPRRYRLIHHKPQARIFSAIDNDNMNNSPILLSIDELEALRLAEIEEMYHADAADKMNVSRQTFGRIIKSARKKVAKHMVDCTTLIVKGGDVKYAKVNYECEDCSHRWKTTIEKINSIKCPSCGRRNIMTENRASKFRKKMIYRKPKGFGFR